MNMKKYFVYAFLLTILFPGIAAANTVYCDGTIEDWDITKSGYVYVDGTWNGSSSSQRLCQVEGSWDDVSSEACKALITAITTALLAQKNVRLRYTGVASCDSSDLGTWTDTIKAPDYIRMYRTP